MITKKCSKAKLRRILADGYWHNVADLARAIQQPTMRTAYFLRQIPGVKRETFPVTINGFKTAYSLYHLEK